MSQCVKPPLAAAALLAATPAFAGALLLPEGEGQLIATTTFADARKAYDRQGRLITTPPYRKFEAQSYVEYGATDWVTLVAEGGAMDFRGSSAPPGLPAQGSAPQYRGLGLGAIGGRIGLFETCGFYFSLEAGLRAASPAAQVFLDMKPGVQAEARLQIFHALEILDLPGFLDAQLGYRARGQNGDETRADLTLGLRPREDFMLLAQSFTALAPWRGGGAFVTQKFQLSGVYDLNRAFSMQLGVAAAPFGFDSPAERAIVTGFWARF